jgi:poly(hydroxyalkanoate) granule-associated protein
MPKKPAPLNTDQPNQPSQAPLRTPAEDPAQQIWLAGLGAFSKVQEQGTKVFETLVKEGLALQRQTQAATQEKIAEANSRISALASSIPAPGLRPDRLETIFEDRVAKALDRLGMPSATQMNELIARLDALERRIAQLNDAAPPETNGAPSPEVPAAAPSAPPSKPAAARRRKASPSN